MHPPTCYCSPGRGYGCMYVAYAPQAKMWGRRSGARFCDMVVYSPWLGDSSFLNSNRLSTIAIFGVLCITTFFHGRRFGPCRPEKREQLGSGLNFLFRRPRCQEYLWRSPGRRISYSHDTKDFIYCTLRAMRVNIMATSQNRYEWSSRRTLLVLPEVIFSPFSTGMQRHCSGLRV